MTSIVAFLSTLDTPNIVHRLEPFELTNTIYKHDRIQRGNNTLLLKTNKLTSVKKEKETTKKETNINAELNTFDTLPSNSDTLFWIYYIIVNGWGAYSMISSLINKSYTQKCKIELVDKLREYIQKNKQSYKLIDIENSLAFDAYLNPIVFFILMSMNHKNTVVVTDNNMYYSKCDTYDNEHIYKIQYQLNKQTNKYTVLPHFDMITEEQYDSIVSSHYMMHSLVVPLRPITYYKVADLTLICEKLKIIIDGKKLKKDVYEMISRVTHPSISPPLVTIKRD